MGFMPDANTYYPVFVRHLRSHHSTHNAVYSQALFDYVCRGLEKPKVLRFLDKVFRFIDL